MDIEREVVDLYRCLLMREHIGETFEGTVSAVVGSGAFISLDAPFVDVLVRYEAMGPDNYQLAEDELSVVGSRSGDTIALGDRVLVTIEDVAILRRQTYGRRVPPEALLKQLKDAPELPRRMQRLGTWHVGPGSKGRSDGPGRGPGRPDNRPSSGRSDNRPRSGGRPDNRPSAERGRPDNRPRSERQEGPSGQRPNQRGPSPTASASRGRAAPAGRSDATSRGEPPGKPSRGGRRK